MLLHAYRLKIQTELLPKSEAGGRGLNPEELDGVDALQRRSGLANRHNHTERSLRVWAVGRNKWAFSAATAVAVQQQWLRSLASCEMVKVDPFAWFRDVLSLIANHSSTKLEGLFHETALYVKHTPATGRCSRRCWPV